MTTSFSRLASLAILAAPLTLSMPAAAYAQNATRFILPSQPLGDALRALGTQTNISIVFDAALVSGRNSKPLDARLSLNDALTQLLAGTGLHQKFINENTVVLEAADKAREGVAASPAVGPVQGETQNTAPSASESSPLVADESKAMHLSQSETAPAGETRGDKGEPTGTAILAEVVVTAQKRTERLLDVPQSVSVVSADTLAKLGAVQFRDFANTIPGLSFFTSGAGYTQISLRGVTTGIDVSSTTAIYVDEVPYGPSSTFTGSGLLTLDSALFDLERIEVLRGPQGTLYGASAMGGLLKYVTRRPDTAAIGGEVQAGVSSTEEGGVNYNVGAAINLPLIRDAVALRASGFESRDGGFIDNTALGKKDVNHSDTYGGRLDLLVTPSDAFSIRVSSMLQNISRDGEATAEYTLAGAPTRGTLDQYRKIAEPFDQHFRLVSGTVLYNFGPATLTSISSYQTVSTDLVRDFSPVYVPALAGFGLNYSGVGVAQTLSTDKFTQEIRLASSEPGLFEWLVGGFYTNENSKALGNFLLHDLSGQSAPNFLYTVLTPSHYKEYAAFGDLTWHITEKLDLTAGLRYAKDEQSFSQIGAGALGVSTPNLDSTEHVLTYLGNARYHFNDHATGYLRYATGYRPGGPNQVTIDPITGQQFGTRTFKSDTLKSYEAGYKAESLDRRFSVDLAVYYIDWNDIQVSEVRNGFSGTVNAPGGATIKGAELTLSAQPMTALTTTAALAYQNAKLTDADVDLGAARGERLPNVPRFTATLNADYAFEEEGLRPTLGGTLRYVSDRTASFDNSPSPRYRLPSYTSIDLRAGMRLGSVDAQFYIHNLGDERGQLSASTALGTPRVAILEPRTVGVSATSRF